MTHDTKDTETKGVVPSDFYEEGRKTGRGAELNRIRWRECGGIRDVEVTPLSRRSASVAFGETVTDDCLATEITEVTEIRVHGRFANFLCSR